MLLSGNFFLLMNVLSHVTFALERVVQQSSNILINGSSKQPPIDTKEETQLRELATLLRQTGNVNGTDTASAQVTAVREGQCKCAFGVCSCCSRFLLDTWRQKACVNVTYDPDEFSFTANILMNDRVLYTRTVSGNKCQKKNVIFNFIHACAIFIQAKVFFFRKKDPNRSSKSIVSFSNLTKKISNFYHFFIVKKIHPAKNLFYYLQRRIVANKTRKLHKKWTIEWAAIGDLRVTSLNVP